MGESDLASSVVGGGAWCEDPVSGGAVRVEPLWVPGRLGSGRELVSEDAHATLDRIGRVAVAAVGSTDDAASVSKRRWDRERRSLGEPGPSAETLRQRFGLPWSTLLEVALAPAGERTLLIGRAAGTDDHFAGSEETLVRALAAVALRLGGPPSALSYDAVARQLEAERARRRLPALRLPSSVTIVALFGSWEAALVRARLLEEGEARKPRTRELPPAWQSLDRFVSETAKLPSRKWFEKWCQAKRIPVGREVKGWPQVVARMRAERAARGEQTPAKVTIATKMPPLPEGEPRGARKRRRATRSDALESLRLYSATLAPGQLPSQRHYREVARSEMAMVGAATLSKFGRFHDLFREATAASTGAAG